MRKIFLLIIFIFGFQTSYAQKSQLTIYTSDIDNFWIAFDRIHTTDGEEKQLKIIQKLYLDIATNGLKDFMSSREHSAKRHLDNIKKYSKFWSSIRPKTEEIKMFILTIKEVF